MAAASLNYGLQPRSKSTAGLLDEVGGHGGPLLLDGGLEVGDVLVGGAAGLSLHFAPNGVVQGVKVGRGGRPLLLRPEVGQVVGAPSLRQLGRVARGPVLLPHVDVLGVVGGQPRLDDVLHDLDVLLGAHSQTLGKPVRGNDLPVAADDPQHHGRGRVLGPHDGGDGLGPAHDEPVVPGVPGLVDGPVLLVRKNLDNSSISLYPRK